MENKILLVDDEKIICKGLARELKSEGYNADWALSGKDALGMVSNNGFGIAIIDFILPDMSGLEVCRRINSLNEKVRMIVMSGDAGALEERKKDFDSISENIRFLYKPFDVEELLKLIQQVS